MTSLRTRTLQGAAVLSAGEVLSYGCALVRNIILARILTKADYGIVASFGIMVSMLDLTGKIGIGFLVVQAKEGNTKEFISTAHFIQAVIGIFTSCLLFLIGKPFAILFGVPDAVNAFQSLSLVPLLGGFLHLDIKRMEREMRFFPSVATELIPQIIITIAAWPLALWFRDYQALLWLLIVKCVLSTIVSQIFARVPYSWTYHWEHILRICTFGWPIMLNSFLMIAIHQGDQFIVGAAYSMEDLAVYSIAVSLSTVPLMMFVNTMGRTMLPVLSPLQDSRIQFGEKYQLFLQSLTTFAVLLSTVLILAGRDLTVLLYGEKYSDIASTIGWLGAAQAIRVMRVGPNMASLSYGDSMNSMITNAIRSVGIIFALIATIFGLELYSIALASFLGEVLSYLSATFLLSKRQGILVCVSNRSNLILSLSLLLNGCIAMQIGNQTISALHIGICIIMSIAFITLLMYNLFAELRYETYQICWTLWNRFCYINNNH